MGIEYRLLYHPKVKKDIQKLHDRVQVRIKEVISGEILLDPLSGIPLGPPLKGFRKYRIEDYRIVYHVQTTEITIISILHRSTVYPQTQRRVL
ncbi:type II toxin-antitoxin system RelE/ParE family toxin [Patescibacteria group bacterium]|nr:MAG: type II toxin-antitoxin system RelE/ParE family toxin [Patescibacteria group bacterium]